MSQDKRQYVGDAKQAKNLKKMDSSFGGTWTSGQHVTPSKRCADTEARNKDVIHEELLGCFFFIKLS